MAEALPCEVREIAHKLSFLGKIPDNHKVDIQRLAQHHKDSWLGTIHRSSNPVSRQTTLDDIRRIVDESLLLLKKYPTDQCISFIITELNAAYMGGIKRLASTTYADDPNISSGLDTLRKEIGLHLVKYQQYLTENGDSPIRGNMVPMSTPIPIGTPAQWMTGSEVVSVQGASQSI